VRHSIADSQKRFRAEPVITPFVHKTLQLKREGLLLFKDQKSVFVCVLQSICTGSCVVLNLRTESNKQANNLFFEKRKLKIQLDKKILR
jgi:hypothetical protein